MKSYIILFSFLILLLAGCNNKKKNVAPGKVVRSSTENNSNINFKSYAEFPSFIKRFLDNKEGGSFLIAGPKEKWNAGCIPEVGIPGKQLIYAASKDSSFIMEYWAGGIATTKRFMQIDFSDTIVINFSDVALINSTH